MYLCCTCPCFLHNFIHSVCLIFFPNLSQISCYQHRNDFFILQLFKLVGATEVLFVLDFKGTIHPKIKHPYFCGLQCHSFIYLHYFGLRSFLSAVCFVLQLLHCAAKIYMMHIKVQLRETQAKKQPERWSRKLVCAVSLTFICTFKQWCSNQNKTTTSPPRTRRVSSL